MDKLKNITVAHITSAHTCEDVRIFHREARLLSGSVREVILLAPDATDSTKDGVRFVRYGSGFPRTRKERIGTAREAAAALEKLSPDLVHFHDPELLISVPDYARRRGIPAIYDVHENYRSTLAENTGGLRGAIASKLYSLYERIKMRKISGIVTVTRQIAEKYEPYGKPVALLRNFPDIERILDLVPDSGLVVEKNSLVYSGSLEQKSLFLLADACLSLRKKHAGLKVHFYGDFRTPEKRDSLLGHWEKRGASDLLDWHHRQERNEFIRGLGGFSAGLVLFWPSTNVRVGLPNKLFEYMAAGLPVIVPDCPNHRETVEKHRCGVYCDTTDAGSIAEAIDRILSDPESSREMGSRGRSACVSDYNMKTDLPNLLDIYRKVTGCPA